MKNIHIFDNGVKVYDDHLLQIQRQRYINHNVHEADEEALFNSIISSLPFNAVYVNVGTAIGYYPILAKKKRCDLKINCFEPLPIHIKYFKENINLNNLSIHDFKLYEIAVSSFTGQSSFKDESYASGITHEKHIMSDVAIKIKNVIRRIFKRKIQISKFQKVKTIKLSQIFSLIQCFHIDFLQMDIQGHEEQVLEAYLQDSSKSLGQVSKILIGTHSEQIHNRCKAFLVSLGYSVEKDEPQSLNQPDGILLGVK